MKSNLLFTFGPVQAFVAQARRTRDLYAGSLLLSHLAMEAMRGVIRVGGRVILPNFEQLAKSEANSEHAAAPNRFVAEFETETQAVDAGRSGKEALLGAWKRVADAVWNQYVKAHVENGRGTDEIWRRQVENFWNISWVVGKEGQDDLLDRRKNWQTHFPPPEPGDHCVLMGQWQELSGFIRSLERRQQDAFWNELRNSLPELDLEENERLCAISFIKRFFPSVSERAIGRKLDLKGWPSTVTIAAFTWMKKVADIPDLHAKAANYAEQVRAEPGALVSSAHHITSLAKFPSNLGAFAKLSGNFLNRTALLNKEDTPLRNENKRPALLAELSQLEQATKDRAGNFYAVLLMDGDSMGALIRQHGSSKVTSALTKFAIAVPGVVKEHDGVTVYAGGDDLLALLPLDRVLEAACAVHALYLGSFGSQIPAFISAAIVFAHYHCTFSRVLASAHELLDDVAKEFTGRDALAIRVLKPGGKTCEWSAPFSHFMKTEPHIFAPLLEDFDDGERQNRNSEAILSTSLLYNLRERFLNLVQGDTAHIERDDLHALFMAESLLGKRDLNQASEQRKQTERMMNHLLDVCQIARRNPETRQIAPASSFSFDGARLVKFLALNGKEGAE